MRCSGFWVRLVTSKRDAKNLSECAKRKRLGQIPSALDLNVNPSRLPCVDLRSFDGGVPSQECL